MSYRLFFVFLVIIIFDYFLASPILGLRESFIVPVLLAVLIIVFEDYAIIAFWGLIFSFLGEILGSFNTGVIIIPFCITLFLYAWVDKFLNLKASRHKEERGVSKFLYELISIISVVFISFSMEFFTDKIFYGKILRWQDWATYFYSHRTLQIIIIQSVGVLLVVTYFKNRKRLISNKRYARI